MNCKISFKLPFLFFVMLFCSVFAQKKGAEDKIVFGKKYTIEDLKKMNGVIRCASTEYEAMLQKKDPKRMTNAQFESWIAPLIANAQTNKSQNGGIVTIPVVVHIIHNGQALGVAPNITDSQVMSQISVMNNDFRRMASTPGFNTNPVGADVMIQFALAKVDPKGNPTDGIDRVNLCQPAWAMTAIDDYVKPVTIWDPTKYMNMWSVNFTDSDLLGYAQFPSTSGLPGLSTNGGYADTDGVVANFSTFGSSDYGTGFALNAPYDKGRTMTHEVGHFLGLLHIWGDDLCGTDYCADTPTAHDSNGGCPTNIASCDDPSIYEMVQNYMDYTNDTCMNIFTINQKDRITAVMNNSPRRMQLKTSIADQAIPLFANDAELKGERSCSETSCGAVSNVTVQYMLYNRGTSALTSAVISYSTNNGVAQTMTWNGNLAQNKYAMINIPTGVSQGSITAEINSVNGTSDQRVGNNSSTVIIGNSVPVTSTSFTFQLQLDPYGSEVSWNLKNSAGVTLYSSGVGYPNATVSWPALISQNWSLPTNDCYTFTINDTFGDGIYVEGGSYRILNSTGAVVVSGNDYEYSQIRTFKVIPALVMATNEVKKDVFGIYPNPADDILNITKVSDKAQFEIYNAVGQLVKSGIINSNQVRVAELIKGTYIITIKDKNVSESIKFIKK